MNKSHWFAVVAFVLALALFSVPSALANEEQITSCGTYNQSDTTYLVMNSLTPTQVNGDCLLILGNNIVVTSGNGPAQIITGNGHVTSTGLRVEGTNVSVSNLVISGFATGVRVSSSNDVHLSSIIAVNSEVGFNFNSMENSTIQDVTAAGGSTPAMVDAFVLTTSNGNTFISNGAFQINGTYLSIYDSSNNTFIGGASSFSRAGIFTQFAGNSHFEQMYLGDVQDKAVELGGGYGNSFDGLTIERAGDLGLLMLATFNNTLSNVNITDTTGMLLIGTSYNNYTNFDIMNVNGWALDLSGTTSETFTNLEIADVHNGGLGIALEGGVGATFNGCSVRNAEDFGIKLENTEDNHFTNCSLDYTDGLSLVTSSHNAFDNISVSNSDDLFGFVGVLLFSNSIDNTFDDLSIVNSTWTGLRVQNSHGNKFTDMSVSGTNNDAIVIDSLASGNSFAHLVVQDTAPGYFDLQQSSARDTRFIDSTIGRYHISDSNFSVVKNGTGQVRLLDIVNVQGMNFSNVFQFSSNLFAFEGNESFSNKSAEVTLHGLQTGRINHAILRNGSVCDTSICTAISIDGSTAIFLVNEMGNYSIRSEDVPAPTTNNGGSNSGSSGPSSRSSPAATTNSITPLSNTNSTPITDTDSDETYVAPITGGIINAIKRPFVWVIVFLAVVAVGFFFVRKMKGSKNSSAPHLNR